MIDLFNRRTFLRLGAAGGAGLLLPASGVLAEDNQLAIQPSLQAPADMPADVSLRIGPVLVEVAKDRTLSTVGYNGGAPGPLIRLREGEPAIVELINDTDSPEFVHWHGQLIPAAVDGAAEEMSLVVPARGKLRYRLTPGPAGLRFVHSHVFAGPDLHRGTYTGQHAPVFIEPAHDPGRYDQEIFLTTHEWEPIFTTEEMGEGEELDQEQQAEKAKIAANSKEERPNGWEIGYQLFSINGRALGYGEPIRVKKGQHVLFHVLNASATENIKLALPGHRFLVVALDGNPVPTPKPVDVLELGTAERIDAIVEMNHPGVWILGTPKDDDRNKGMGIVIEYAGAQGRPRWLAPPKSRWNYAIFGADRPAANPDHVIPLVFGKINGGKGGFNRWTINGVAFDAENMDAPGNTPMKLQKGSRYRLSFENQSDDPHPVHLHRNVFELTSIDDKPTAGVMKDVVLVKGYGKVEVDFTADQPGLTLFHCHQQLHMDFGFMKVFDVA
jgi:FtsP/CotA-like multicopper oxidase with cupredoxin domain